MRIGYVALASTRMALAFAAAIVRKLTTCSSAAKGQSDDERAQENSHRMTICETQARILGNKGAGPSAWTGGSTCSIRSVWSASNLRLQGRECQAGVGGWQPSTGQHCFALTANKVANFYSTVAGHWHSILTA